MSTVIIIEGYQFGGGHYVLLAETECTGRESVYVFLLANV